VYFKNPSSASAVAIISGRTVVLVKRKVDPYAGSWCLPSGFEEYDETPEETAVREAKEETNLDIRLLGLFRVYFSRGYTGKNTVVHVYLAEPAGGTMRPGDDASNVKAFPFDRLPAHIAFRKQLEIVEELKRGNIPGLCGARAQK
jgi:8-oxo-dGTP diphosphatase